MSGAPNRISYCGQSAPLRRIVGPCERSAIGMLVLLDCGHARAIRDWDIMPAMGRKRPTQSRCGFCRDGDPPHAKRESNQPNPGL